MTTSNQNPNPDSYLDPDAIAQLANEMYQQAMNPAHGQASVPALDTPAPANKLDSAFYQDALHQVKVEHPESVYRHQSGPFQAPDSLQPDAAYYFLQNAPKVGCPPRPGRLTRPLTTPTNRKVS